MKYLVQITQINPDGKHRFIDRNAIIEEIPPFRRLSYQETDGVYVNLDISQSGILLKRTGEWLTLAHMPKKNEGYLKINSEEGTLKFKLDVTKYELNDNDLIIDYILKDGDELVSKHSLSIEWTQEG